MMTAKQAASLTPEDAIAKLRELGFAIGSDHLEAEVRALLCQLWSNGYFKGRKELVEAFHAVLKIGDYQELGT